jgi:diguanylate cyclase (GGDEF)-like protein
LNGQHVQSPRSSPHSGGLDLRLAARVAGVFALAGAVLLLTFSPLTPPTMLAGVAGWGVLAAIVLLWAATGVVILRRETATDAEMLAALAGGTLTLGVVGLLSGPFAAALELAVALGIMAAIVLPLRLAAVTVGLGFLAVGLPTVHDPSTIAFAVFAGRASLLCGLAAAATAWTSRVVELRAELADQRAQADRLARVDVLTGLGNRRALDEAVRTEREVTRRTGRPLSALVLDLDDFKRINDGAGHHEGDRLLQEVASVLRAQLRRPDRCFRWGGDEFVALLPDTSIAFAERAAVRVVEALREHSRRPDGEPLAITVGCAELRDGETGEELLSRADAALFSAKGDRSRVALADPLG